ncbi:MAG: hypothetical protein IIC91_01305 [Chloroflexi bacterium]|nr:hypothetical protein [Chloroflexota bacterium]
MAVFRLAADVRLAVVFGLADVRLATEDRYVAVFRLAADVRFAVVFGLAPTFAWRSSSAWLPTFASRSSSAWPPLA